MEQHSRTLPSRISTATFGLHLRAFLPSPLTSTLELMDNAVKAVHEAEAFLNSTICGPRDSDPAIQSTEPPVPVSQNTDVALKSDFPDMTHDELRKLLTEPAHLSTKFMEIDGYWTAHSNVHERRRWCRRLPSTKVSTTTTPLLRM